MTCCGPKCLTITKAFAWSGSNCIILIYFGLVLGDKKQSLASLLNASLIVAVIWTVVALYLRYLKVSVDSSRIELWQLLCELVQGILTLWVGCVAIAMAQREHPKNNTSYFDEFLGFGIVLCIFGLFLTLSSIGLCSCPMSSGKTPWQALSGRAHVPSDDTASPEADRYASLIS